MNKNKLHALVDKSVVTLNGKTFSSNEHYVKELTSELRKLAVEAYGLQKDYKPHITKIDELLSTDFAFEMMTRHAMDEDFECTQADAHKMAELLGDIYQIAHTIHCKACAKTLI